MLTTLNLTLRRKREFFLVALPVLVGDVVSMLLISNGGSLVFVEEFSEVWNRVSGVWDRIRSEEPSRWLQEYWTELGSIEWDLASWGLPMLVGGAISYLATVFIHIAAVSRICVIDLSKLHGSVVEALRWSIARMSSLSALFARILAGNLAAIVVLSAVIVLGVAMTDVFVPVSVVLFALAVLTVLAMCAAIMLAPGVLAIAFVTSAVGQREPKLRYAMRLMRGRFWATSGKVYLIAVIAGSIGTSIGTMSELLVSIVVPDIWHGAYLIRTAIELAGFTVCTAGACVLYHDLGGEIA